MFSDSTEETFRSSTPYLGVQVVQADYLMVIQEDVTDEMHQSKGQAGIRSESKTMHEKQKRRSILIRKNELTL